MTIAISLPDPLENQLRLMAEAERTSVDQVVSAILTRAIERPLDALKWGQHNQRRVALIRRRFTCGLSPVEQRELGTLQDLADRQLETLDRQMLADAEAMKRAVESSCARPDSQ